MKEEFSASVCCSWDAVRMTAENGAGADGGGGAGLDASKTDLRGPRRGSPCSDSRAWGRTGTGRLRGAADPGLTQLLRLT
ncbi:hypothetical protein San01_52300 [Streptomyces angustmyceticus]|uniref:Uncharacterized protein n=1 Tax=Streptomyces angustmyceticus TaxID=285578 RepID=A0A5J4LL39_9ACTN|nr:hypothetical protein San01_52300 [Streptomyces angustmyceticus]